MFASQGGSLDKRFPWHVGDAYQILDGTEFVTLRRKDTGFARFVLGSSDAGLRDWAYLYLLKQMRTDASGAAITGDEPTLDLPQSSSGPDSPRPKTLIDFFAKRPERVKARTLERDAKTIELDLPMVEFDGVVAPAMTMVMPICLSRTVSVSIPLTNEALHYVRIATLAHGKADVKPRQSHGVKCESGVVWSEKRSAFIGKRVRPDTADGLKHDWKVLKVCRTGGNDIEFLQQLDQARDQMRAWLGRSLADEADDDMTRVDERDLPEDAECE